MTDAEILAANAHIPDAEIRTDIEDTETEINDLRKKISWTKQVIESHEKGIEERISFIDKLQNILKLRGTL